MKAFPPRDYGTTRLRDHGATGPRGHETTRPRVAHSSFIIHHSSFPPSPAFSLVEILVTVALLSFIVLGLFAMFNQTQRAFMTGMGQTDVLEASRAATDMFARDCEQLTPSHANAINYYAQVFNATPLTQNLPGTTLARTYYLEDFFVLTRQNQTWTGIGYCVRTSDANGRLYPAEIAPGQAGVGSLYRFTKSLPVLYSGALGDPRNGLPQDPGQLFRDFQAAFVPGSSVISNRICDGVVHFHVRAFATNGFPIISDGTRTNALFRTNASNYGCSVFHQASVRPKIAYPDQLEVCYSWSNAVPAALEFELGMLDPRTFARYGSIADSTARRNYFQREDLSTRVHLFRQRVPVRNVDPAAFQ
jgi:hypothetical protein